MKIEKLNNNSLNRRKFLYTLICVVLLLIIIGLFLSHAKYRQTQSIQIATGTINYTNADFTLVAIKVKASGATDYANQDSVPTSGYDLTSYECKVGSETASGVTVEYFNDGTGTVNVSGVSQKGTKCTLYFDVATTKKVNTVLGTIVVNLDTPNFANTSCVAGTNNGSDCDEATNGIYETQDADGTTYYYRGTVDNNWVSFAGFYWRIIRINGNGTIRLIYNGTNAGATGTDAQLSSTSAFNEYYEDNVYVGYMYGTVGSDNYTDAHTNTTDTTIKSAIDTWYESNLKTNYASYLDGNTGWCGDRAIDSGNGYGITETYYKAYYRLNTNKTPSYECSQSNDLYTTTDSTIGNKGLTYPIGLITADEVAYAGGKYNTINYGYWLNTGSTYWSMSPSYFNSDIFFAYVFRVNSNGYLHIGVVRSYYGVRPVINLKADTQFTGTGTTTDVYKVVGAS